MNFKTEDYLTYDEIKQLIKSEYTHDKATIVCNKLIKYCFVFNDELYVLQPNKTYQLMLNLKASLINSIIYNPRITQTIRCQSKRQINQKIQKYCCKSNFKK
jgi:hypothetical protein